MSTYILSKATFFLSHNKILQQELNFLIYIENDLIHVQINASHKKRKRISS